MARDDDEGTTLGPKKAWLEPRLLEPMSVAELEAYIEALKGEIDRATQAIAGKRSHRSGAEAFFKKS